MAKKNLVRKSPRTQAPRNRKQTPPKKKLQLVKSKGKRWPLAVYKEFAEFFVRVFGAERELHKICRFVREVQEKVKPELEKSNLTKEERFVAEQLESCFADACMSIATVGVVLSDGLKKVEDSMSEDIHKRYLVKHPTLDKKPKKKTTTQARGPRRVQRRETK